MNLVLIGYRGTGKTAVADLLAQRLGRHKAGMDDKIVQKAGRSIPEIVEERGWTAFRDIESEVAREAGALDDAIVDCGGGVIERPENIEALKRNGTVFWLRASVGTIVDRIAAGTERPSLTGAKSFTEEVQDVLARRNPLYGGAADHVIETDDRTPEQVADEIERQWGDL